MGIPALPFSKWADSVQKPKKDGYPSNPKTIGEHIKKRRLDLNLFQKDVARVIGVTEDTIINWEVKGIAPQMKYMSRIVEFLG